MYYYASLLKKVIGVLHFGNHYVVSKLCLTLCSPGYLRKLTIREGALKAHSPPPYDLENFCINHYHIIRAYFTRCLTYVAVGIFQEFAILTILQQFKNKN